MTQTRTGVIFEGRSKGLFSSNKIVSIGNLHEFKTYNKHIIKIFPELLKIRSELIYEIYGEGSMKRELKNLVKKMNLENKIFFKGMIPYEKFNLALEDSFLFVGSGTAIIEAASLGVPSIVGVESIGEPNTYGYFSETSGFTYNEYDKNKTQYTIFSKVEDVLKSEEKWNELSIQCKKRANEFSLDKTTQGFISLIDNENNKISIKDFENYSNMKLFWSFMWCALMSVFKIDQTFQKRKDQGTF